MKMYNVFFYIIKKWFAQLFFLGGVESCSLEPILRTCSAYNEEFTISSLMFPLKKYLDCPK